MPDQEPKPLHRYRLWEFQAIRDALVILALFGVLWLGSALSLVTVPLLLGLGLAYLIEPVVRWLTGRFHRLTRLRAVLLIAAMVVLLIGGMLAFTVPPLVSQGIALVGNADRYATRAMDWLHHPDRPSWLRDRMSVLDAALKKAGCQKEPPSTDTSTVPVPAPVMATAPGPASGPVPLDEARIRQLIREEMVAPASATAGSFSDRVLTVLKAVGSGIATVAGGLFTIVLTCAIAAVTTVSFSLAWPDVLAAGRDFIPSAHRDRVLELVERMDRTVSAFIRGRLTVAAIVGCLYAIGWTVVGVPYGLLLGLMVGVFSLVPYLAALGLPVAWLLLTLQLIAHPDPDSWYLAAGADGALGIVWWKVLVLPWLVNFIAQQTEDYVLNPLIQGKATELHPAAIMIAVIAGGSLAGLYGMLLAVPVAACGKILLTAEILPRFKRWVGRSQESLQMPSPRP